MRLEQLEYLLAIQKHHSMTAAADILHVTQQSISVAIKSLEDEMTIPLLERSKKGSYLTPAGEEVAEFAKDIFTRWEEILFKYVRQNFHNQSVQNIDLYVHANFLVSPDLAKLSTHIKKYIPNSKININATNLENIIYHVEKSENAIGIFMVKEHELKQLERNYNTFVIDRHYVGFSGNKNSAFLQAGDYSLKNLRNQNIYLMHEKNAPENLLQEIVDFYKLEEHNNVTYNVPSVVLSEYQKNDYGIFLGMFSHANIKNPTTKDYLQRVLATENIQRINVAITNADYLNYILQKTFISS